MSKVHIYKHKFQFAISHPLMEERDFVMIPLKEILVGKI